MITELKHLLWLQWRLTLSIFRSRRTSDRLRVLGLLMRGLSFAFTLPMFVLMGAGLAVGLILLSPDAAYEVVIAVNTFLLFIWLLLPASANSQMVERFEMARLFPHPIRFRSIVVGSTLISLLTVTGLWTVPLLLGEVVGLTFHQPLALPLIVIGTLPTFALLVLSGRIMDDFFDLVSGDRRLRALVLGVLSFPFMLCWLGQYIVQFATDNYENMDWIVRLPLTQVLDVERLSAARNVSEWLEALQLSRLLIWLPPGWASAGMGSAVIGEWWTALAFLALSVGFVALLLWVHAGIVRRLMQGAALSIGAERVRSRGGALRLPGPPALWALFRKDWAYLWRSPMPRRLLFSSLIMIVAMVFPLRSMAGESDIPSWVREALPLLSAAFILTLTSMTINLGLTANYWGTIDREGFATLALSAIDRRQTLLSANLAVLLYAGVQFLLLCLGIAILTGQWVVLPLGVYLGLCLQVGGAPAYNLAAILGPFRTQLKYSGGRQRGNLWGMLAWAVSAPPVLALIVLPYLFWQPGLIITLPLGVLYSAALYGFTLKPLAGLLMRRESAVLEAITAED